MFGSWFKGGKSGRKKKAKRSTKAVQTWDPQRTLVGARILVAAATLVAVIVGWRSLSSGLHQYALQRHATPVTAATIDLVDAPAWMSEAVQEELRLEVARWASNDPLDGRSLWLAASSLQADPWVRDVHQVRRRADGTIAVTATYREPVAVIQSYHGWHLVDAEGVNLPGLYAEHQAMQLGLPRIVGVTQQPPQPGHPWTASDVLAGLDLALTLENEPYADQIVAYDVKERDTRGRTRLVLLTERGMVRWGLPPGEELSIEPDTGTKIRWLRRVHRDLGQIDAGGKVVDLYGAQPMTYTTVEASQRTGL